MIQAEAARMAVAEDDQFAVDEIVCLFERYRALPGGGEPLEWVTGCTSIPRLRVYALVRKYLAEIARRLGAKRGVYRPAERSVSGRGAFGRLGGSGKRSVYYKPRARFEYE